MTDIPNHDAQLDAPLYRQRDWADPDDEADEADQFDDGDEIVCESCEAFDCGVHEGGLGIDAEADDTDNCDADDGGDY